MEHNIPSKVYITEEERVKLVAQSAERRQVIASFAGDKIWLDNIAINAWAFALLADWRGLNT